MTSKMEGSEENLDETTEKQETTAFLRQRYLYLLSTICSGSEECSIRMYENTNVTCQVKAFDLNFENVIVANLKTPLPEPIKEAKLRTSDIISMKFKCKEELLK